MTSRTSVLVMPGGVLSRDGTAGLGRTVWSTTTNRRGRSVERQLECRGRLVWRTRRPWERSVSVVAPGAPGGGALARARTTSGWALTLGRARILRSASRRRGTWRNAADAFGRQRNAGITASSPMNGSSSARVPDRREFGTTAGLARFHRSRVALKRTQAWG